MSHRSPAAPHRRSASPRRGGLRFPAVAVLAAAAWTQPAWADCTVATTGLVFGQYDPFSSQPLDGAGTVQIDCVPAAAYTIAMSAGAGTYALRSMLSGSDRLDYNLYADSTRTMVWGDGSAGTVTVTGIDASASHTVYGRVPARQNVRAGNYADSIIVTLTF